MKKTILLLAALAAPASCTNTVGGGGEVVVDASVDATPQPDALPPGFRDGEGCSVSPDDASGGCAPGYACTVVGGGPSQCRQTCPTLQFSCAGYSGPGYSLCALTYSDDNGQSLGNLCLVVCGDENQTLRGCDEGACNGSCPGDWSCETDPINTGLKSCR